MQHNHIATPRLYAVQHISQVIERVYVADRHQNIARARANRFGRKLTLHRQMELVHLYVLRGAVPMMRHALRQGKNNEKKYRKGAAGNRSFGLGEKIDHRDTQEHQCDQPKANGNLYTKHVEIQRNPVFAVSGVRVAQHQYCDSLHREAPDHSERVEVRKKRHVAPAYDDREDLQCRDDVYDPVRCAETPVWLAEPARKNAVL